MSAVQYALVAYIRDPVGQFVEGLRRELHPAHPEWPAHLTVMPPRDLDGSEVRAAREVEEICRGVAPFEILMGSVETFAPATPTVFVRVAYGAFRLRDLHDRLAQGVLAAHEPWPYMPHLTIAKLPDQACAMQGVEVARQRWSEFRGSRIVHIDEVTLVKQAADSALRWLDLYTVRLQGQPVRR